MVGQEHITRTLRNSLKTGRIRHAYLFSGPRGTGKTTSARLLAKAINCHDANPDNRPCNQCPACVAVNEGRYLDLIEIDAATHTGVDDVRDLRDKIAFAPGEGTYKVYIIDEVHRFTGNAFDALLKTLEEPPPHAVFVLATTEIDKVPATIKSRCLPFEFRRVSLHEVADRLQMITESEGLNIERAALELIARQGTGSVRDSISLLDQVVSDPEEHITLETVQRILGTANIAAVKEVVAALVAGDAAGGLHIINAAVDGGSDPRQMGEQIVDHLRAVLLTQTASADLVEASAEDRALYQQQAEMIERGRLLKALRTFNEAVNEYKGGWQPQLTLELALLESLRDDVPPMMMMAAPQQHSAPPPVQMPPAVALPPGAPPVIELGVVQARWNEMLRVLSRQSKTAPDVLAFFRVLRVDGNTVVVGTDNEMYFNRLNEPQKIRLMEWALSAVHKISLKIKLVMATEAEMSGHIEANPLDMNDPLLSEGAQLGAKITPIEKPGRQSRE